MLFITDMLQYANLLNSWKLVAVKWVKESRGVRLTWFDCNKTENDLLIDCNNVTASRKPRTWQGIASNLGESY